MKEARLNKKHLRPVIASEVELPTEFLPALSEALESNPNVHNGIAGFLLGRGLMGNYKVRLRGAYLVLQLPDAPGAKAANGTP